jgi:hypothetical protein
MDRVICLIDGHLHPCTAGASAATVGGSNGNQLPIGLVTTTASPEGANALERSFQMSTSNVAGEAIGTAVRHLATFAIWMILVAAVVVAIVTGLRALRRRQEAGLRDQAADHQATSRPALTRRTVRPGSRLQPNAINASTDSRRGESAPDNSRVPVQSR